MILPPAPPQYDPAGDLRRELSEVLGLPAIQRTVAKAEGWDFYLDGGGVVRLPRDTAANAHDLETWSRAVSKNPRAGVGEDQWMQALSLLYRLSRFPADV